MQEAWNIAQAESRLGGRAWETWIKQNSLEGRRAGTKEDVTGNWVAEVKGNRQPVRETPGPACAGPGSHLEVQFHGHLHDAGVAGADDLAVVASGH